MLLSHYTRSKWKKRGERLASLLWKRHSNEHECRGETEKRKWREEGLQTVQQGLEGMGKGAEVLQEEHRRDFDSVSESVLRLEEIVDAIPQEIKSCSQTLDATRCEVRLITSNLMRMVLFTFRTSQQSVLRRIWRRVRSPFFSEVAFLNKRGDIDPYYYWKHFPQAVESGLTATEHYVRYGAALGVNPSRSFDTKKYLFANPDVCADGINPLVHSLLVKGKQ